MRKWISVCDVQTDPDHEDERADFAVKIPGPDGELVIDLCHAHHTQFQAFVAQQEMWLKVAHAPEDEEPRPKKPSGGSPKENAAIRAWDRSRGGSLGERGRIPQELRKAWIDAGRPEVSPLVLVRPEEAPAPVAHPSLMNGARPGVSGAPSTGPTPLYQR